MRFVVVTAIVAVIAFIVVGGVNAAWDGGNRFQSPSGKIRCKYVPKRDPYIVCTNLQRKIAVISVYGKAQKGIGAVLSPAKVLPYGKAFRAWALVCKSEERGMHCWSAYTGNSFWVYRYNVRIGPEPGSVI